MFDSLFDLIVTSCNSAYVWLVNIYDACDIPIIEVVLGTALAGIWLSVLTNGRFGLEWNLSDYTPRSDVKERKWENNAGVWAEYEYDSKGNKNFIRTREGNTWE